MAQSIVAVTVSSDDPRSVRALEVLATSDTWIKAHLKADGHRFMVIPSRDGQHVYWTDCHACTCPDFTLRQLPCKHTLAVRLWAAQKRAEQTAKEHRCQQARERRQQTKQERASEPAPSPAPTPAPVSDYDKYFPEEEDHVHTGSTCFCLAPPLSFGPAVHPLVLDKIAMDCARDYAREDD